MGEETKTCGAVMNFHTTIKDPSDDSLFFTLSFPGCILHGTSIVTCKEAPSQSRRRDTLTLTDLSRLKRIKLAATVHK